MDGLFEGGNEGVEDLFEIASLAADFARRLEIEPRVAFLSFSNFGSTPHPLSDKVRKAVELTKTRRPDLLVDGEMQADTAVVADIIENRYPFSSVKDANVLVFPSLESANIAYKLLANLGKAKAIGPILLGMGAPVHVLQTGDDVNAIVMEKTGGLGVDVVLEMAGHPDSIRTAFDIVRRGGRISLLGLTSKPISLNFSEDIIFKGITVQGINGRRMYQTWYQMTALLKSGKLDLHPVITDRIAMKDFTKAMDRLKTGEASKILVYPNGTK